MLYFNFPLYTLIWLLGVFFSGGYDQRYSLRRLVRGLIVGTVVLLAVYGLLDMEYRFSRALVLLGAAWSVGATTGLRAVLHFLQYKTFRMGQEQSRNLVIVGQQEESERVQQLLHKAEVAKNFHWYCRPGSGVADRTHYLSSLAQLDEVVHIYNIQEVIFCSRDVRTQDIMSWMSRLGPAIDYKIVPKESVSIIGSSSKNSSGQLYTIDIQYNIAQPMSRRNKRVLDLLLALGLLLSWPLQLLLVKQPLSLLRNITSVLLGRRTWVGYAATKNHDIRLPKLRSGVLSPLDGLRLKDFDEPTRQRLNFLYAKDYQTSKDVDVVLRGWRGLGRSSEP